MNDSNAAMHYLAGAFDANASSAWIRRARRPDAPILRLLLIHPSLGFLQRVRAIARCGSITARASGSREWRVEGSEALRLAGELASYLLRPIPLDPDLPETAEPRAAPPAPRTAPDAATVAAALGVTGQYLARLAGKLGVGERRGEGRRAVWAFSEADIAALRARMATHGRTGQRGRRIAIP